MVDKVISRVIIDTLYFRVENHIYGCVMIGLRKYRENILKIYLYLENFQQFMLLKNVGGVWKYFIDVLFPAKVFYCSFKFSKLSFELIDN